MCWPYLQRGLPLLYLQCFHKSQGISIKKRSAISLGINTRVIVQDTPSSGQSEHGTDLNSSGVYICKSVANDLRNGNYIRKSEGIYRPRAPHGLGKNLAFARKTLDLY